MTLDAALPLVVLLTSAVPGLAIFFLGEERHLARTALARSAGDVAAAAALLGVQDEQALRRLLDTGAPHG